ncbi:hypothetical protein NDU88_003297 [Pleurodeles waltl]|uniref:Uncharacterized protein n=1 Tax=Pleurodeles waltl TaxID=8319 RepID=A0AAV7UDB1_PLEWA|nr:hypothetical protein NDU88_003297 [Pleurodeles waltl]
MQFTGPSRLLGPTSVHVGPLQALPWPIPGQASSSSTGSRCSRRATRPKKERLHQRRAAEAPMGARLCTIAGSGRSSSPPLAARALPNHDNKIKNWPPLCEAPRGRRINPTIIWALGPLAEESGWGPERQPVRDQTEAKLCESWRWRRVIIAEIGPGCVVLDFSEVPPELLAGTGSGGGGPSGREDMMDSSGLWLAALWTDECSAPVGAPSASGPAELRPGSGCTVGSAKTLPLAGGEVTAGEDVEPANGGLWRLSGVCPGGRTLRSLVVQVRAAKCSEVRRDAGSRDPAQMNGTGPGRAPLPGRVPITPWEGLSRKMWSAVCFLGGVKGLVHGRLES